MPLGEAIPALDNDPDSLREAIYEPPHAEKGGQCSTTDVSGCARFPIRMETRTNTIQFPTKLRPLWIAKTHSCLVDRIYICKI